ncbi:MAG: hypothetical protein QOG43_2592 [Actinomycetota bacterium]|jgi:hypothetical protein|nr:hypothetical protein [Actinomycetota bacterium]
MRITTARLAGLGLAAALSLVACGGGGSGTPSTAAAGAATTATTAAAPVPTVPATTVVPPTTTAAPSAAGKVSANDATRAELQAAFTAAGISSPAQWAREVEEYRPYVADDPTFAKLRQELAKYNPGPGVVDQIVATLVP